MFQDLIVKLNISIDACLNVQKMKTKNRVISGLIISAILASGLFAVNGEIDRKDEKRIVGD